MPDVSMDRAEPPLSSSVNASGASSSSATPSASEPSLTILVKNPTDRPGSPPFTLPVPLSSTVLQLKQRLSNTYPGSPAVTAQRLIYAGKLLQNSHKIATVLPNADTSATHTFHLVVSTLFPPVSTGSVTLSNGMSFPSAAAFSSASPGAFAAPVTAAPPSSNASASAPPGSSGTPTVPSMPGGAPYGAPFIPPSFYGTAPLHPQPQPPFYFGQPYYGVPLPPMPTDQTGSGAATSGDSGSAYRAHLQMMERLIAESWQAHMHAAAASAAAQANGQNASLAMHLRSHASQLEAHAAALHAQAQAQARAQATVGGGTPPALDGAQLPTPPPHPPMQQAPPPHPPQVQAAPRVDMHPFQERFHEANAQAAAQRDVAERAAMAANAAAQRVFAEARGPGGRARPANGIGFDIRLARFPADANLPGGEPRVRQFVFRLQLNWVLLLKLFVFVYVLGQDASRRRMYALILLAVSIYMWQMGYLRFVRRFVETALPNPRLLMEQLFPAARRPPPAQNTQQQPNRAAAGAFDDAHQPADQPQHQRVGQQPPRQQEQQQDGHPQQQQDQGETPAHQPHRFGRIAVVLSFLYSFVYGFVCSLVPAWNPEPHARLDDLIPRHGNAQEQGHGQRQAADVAPNANAPNDARHEHAE